VNEPLTYTNRKGVTYYLCCGQTKTGKPRYYFAREPRDAPVTEIPPGFEITESVNGIVSLARSRPQLVSPDAVVAVEAELDRHPKARNYRLNVRPDRIEIYELLGLDAETLLTKLGAYSGFSRLDLAARLKAEQERYGQFTAVLRFNLVDAEQQVFQTERMCYLGSVDDWIPIGPAAEIPELAARYVPLLGSDALLEIYSW